MFDNEIILNEIKKYKYKIELHCHTKPASPCSEILPERLVEAYKELGFDAVVLTNHYAGVVADQHPSVDDYLDVYFGDYEKTKAAGEKVGLKVYLGLEVRFRENNNDYLVFGLDTKTAKSIYPYLEKDLATFRSEFKGDYILIQAHPQRVGMTPMDDALLDGIEVFNMHPNHNSRIAYASRVAAANGGIITAGSDYHHENMAGTGAIRTKHLPDDEKALAELLRSGDYLMDVGGLPIIPRVL